MKQHFGKIIALSLVLAMTASFAACNKGETNSSTTEPSIGSSQPYNGGEDASLAGEETVPSVSDSVSAVNGTTSSGTASTSKNQSGRPAGPGQSTDSLVGTNKTKIAAYYNQAISKASAQGKVSGSDNMEVGNILMYGKPNNFLNDKVSSLMKMLYKPTSLTKLPPASGTVGKVNASDLASASCTKNGGKYVIKLTAITETNPSANSANGRLFNMRDDIFSQIPNYLKFKNGPSKDLSVRYSGSTITAVIDSSTGKLEKLTSVVNCTLGIKNASFYILSIDERGASCNMKITENYTVSF